MSIIAVSTAQELLEALESAHGGDRIELAAGDYGDVSLKKLAFDSKVTIASADPEAMASFNTVSLSEVVNVTFDGIFFDFVPTAETESFHSALRVAESSSISVVNSVFEGDLAVDGFSPDTDPAIVGTSGVDGFAVGRAAVVHFSEDITFSNNEISMFRAGITAAYVDGLTLEGNDLHDLRTTPINGGAVSDVVITDNHVYDMDPWAPLLENGLPDSSADHGDFIHFWTIDGQEGKNSNIYIADNFFELGNEGVQNASVLGIYLDDKGRDIGFENVLIENNVLHNDALQGVAAENVTGLVIRDNTFLQSGGTESQAPGVVLRFGTRDVIVENNILTETGGEAIHGTSLEDMSGLNINVSGNLQVQRFNPEADNYIGDLFVNALTPNGDLEDFKVVPGSAADGVGAEVLQTAGESSLIAITADAQTGLDSLSVTASVSDLLGNVAQSSLANLSIKWDFGDGTTGSGLNVEHSYATSGSYKITGTVTAGDGTKLLLNKVVEVVTPAGIIANFDTAIRDESDTVNGVTITGDAVLKTAADGKALDLQSADARVKFDVNEELSNNREFTLSFDFKYDDESQDGSAIYFPGTAVMRLNNGQLELIGKTSLNEAINFQTTGTRLDDSSWHRISYVFSNGTGTASLYLDGAIIATLTGLNGIQPPSQSHGLTIGSPFGSSFTGQVDNVSFLRAALTESDVEQLHSDSDVILSDLEGIPLPLEVAVPEPETVVVAQPVQTTSTQSQSVSPVSSNASSDEATSSSAQSNSGASSSGQTSTQAAEFTFGSTATAATTATTTPEPVNTSSRESLQETLAQFAGFTISEKNGDAGGWLELLLDDTGVSEPEPTGAIGLHLFGDQSAPEEIDDSFLVSNGFSDTSTLIGSGGVDFG